MLLKEYLGFKGYQGFQGLVFSDDDNSNREIACYVK